MRLPPDMPGSLRHHAVHFRRAQDKIARAPGASHHVADEVRQVGRAVYRMRTQRHVVQLHLRLGPVLLHDVHVPDARGSQIRLHDVHHGRRGFHRGHPPHLGRDQDGPSPCPSADVQNRILRPKV